MYSVLSDCEMKRNFLFLLFIMLMSTMSFVSNDGIKFVNMCPYSRLAWSARESLLECKSEKVYHCVMTNNNKLSELCMRKHFLLPSDGCPWIDLAGSIEEFKYTHNCSMKNRCPKIGDGPYVSNNLYIYPGCFGNRGEESNISTKMMSRYESTYRRTLIRNSTKNPTAWESISYSSIFEAVYSFQSTADGTSQKESHSYPATLKPKLRDSIGVMKSVSLIVGGIFIVLALIAVVLSCRKRLTRIKETVKISKTLNEVDLEENVYDSIESVDDLKKQDPLQSLDDENSFLSSNQSTENDQDVIEERLEYEEPAKNHYNKLDLHQAYADRELKEKVYNAITKETEFSGADSFESDQTATQLEDTNDVHQETMEDK